MCLVIAGLYAALLMLGLLVTLIIYPFEAPLPYALGLTLGCLLSLGKVILLEKALDRSLDAGEEKSAKNYAHFQSILRYLLTIAVLLVVVLFPRVFGLFGVILGVLSLQISAYITGAIVKKMPIG